MALANPTELGTAAEKIESLMEQGLGDEPLRPDNESPPEPQQAEPSEAPVEAEAPAQPVEQPSQEESPPEEKEAQSEVAEQEADSESFEELPDTWMGIAEAIGMDSDAFADHVQAMVTVNGESKLVTLKELQRGYQREADYSAKTMELGEQRRAWEKQVMESQKEWQSRFENLATLTQQLQQTIQGEEAALDQILQNEGADAYLTAKAKIDAQKEVAKRAQAERDQALQKQQEQQMEAFQSYVAQQAEALKQAMPEFAHPQKAEKLQGRIRNHLKADGYTDEEIGNIVDHRHVLTAWKAMQYDELQKARPEVKKKLQGLPRVVKPNATPEKGEVQAERRGADLQRLRKSGDRHDAARIFESLL